MIEFFKTTTIRSGITTNIYIKMFVDGPEWKDPPNGFPSWIYGILDDMVNVAVFDNVWC